MSHPYKRIREAAGSRLNMPVELVPGNQEPEETGTGCHYVTAGGHVINYPSAYSKRGWSNMFYVASTSKVVCGIEWARKNTPEAMEV